MTGSYPFEENTTVVLAPSVTDIAAPTAAEIRAGADVTCELTRDGLNLSSSTTATDRTRWLDDLVRTEPGRVTFDNAALKAKRQRPPALELLWRLGVLRTHRFLIVRRGVSYGTPWTAGQAVEVYDVELGQRSPQPSAANTTVTFVIQLFIAAYSDAAVVS